MEHKYKKNHGVSNSGTCDAELGRGNLIIESNKSSEKGDDRSRDSEKKNKKRKKKRVKEDSKVGHLGIKEVTREGKEAVNPDEDIKEKVERKKKKIEKHKTSSETGHQFLEQGFDDVEGHDQSTLNETGGNEIQNHKVVETIEKESVVKVAKSVGKKKRKREKRKTELDFDAIRRDLTNLIKNISQDNEHQNVRAFEIMDKGCNRGTMEKSENRNQRKKEEEMNNSTAREAVLAENCNQGNNSLNMDKKENRDANNANSKGKRRNAKSVANGCQDLEVRKNKKKVTFSDHIEVFLVPDDPSRRAGKNEEKLVQGRRFSREEDEIIKEAIYKYIDAACLGEEGLNMVLNFRSYPKLGNCWKELGTALPYRPYTAFYKRAQTLFQRSKQVRWTNEDCEMIQKFQEKPGNQQKVLAGEIVKKRVHVKDAWRRIRCTKLKKGARSPEGIQSLFELVNTDLQMKCSEEKKSKHGMLQDNICWTAISNKLSTQTDAACCLKRYNQLASSMGAEGDWADADDRHLINSLYQLDASCIEDVNWDNLLEHRTGDACRKRWSQMILHIGYHRNKSFSEQVEVLGRRYCSDLLEARKA